MLMAKKDIPLTDDNLQRTSVGQIRRKLLRYSIIATTVGQVLVIVITAILYTLFDGMNSYLAFIITMTSNYDINYCVRGSYHAGGSRSADLSARYHRSHR